MTNLKNGIAIWKKKTAALASAMVVAIVLSLLFQNCTNQLQFAPSNSDSEAPKSNLALSTNESNGSGYDGKLTAGLYMRAQPRANCAESLTDTHGRARVTTEKATIELDDCTTLSASLDYQDARLYYLAFHPEILAINGAVFEEEKHRLKTFPHIEAWCSVISSPGLSATSQQGISILVKSDPSRTRFLAEVVEGTRNSLQDHWTQMQTSAFMVDRSAATTTLSEFSSKAEKFNLAVNWSERQERAALGTLEFPKQTIANEGLSFVSASLRKLNCFHIDSLPAIAPALPMLAGLWMMDQPFGSVSNAASIDDSTSYSYHGVAINPDGLGMAYKPGRFGRSLYFDGVDDRVDLAAMTQKLGPEMSLSAWFSPASLATNKGSLFSFWSNRLTDMLEIFFGGCGQAPGGNLLSVMTAQQCKESGLTPIDYQWYHLGVVSNGREIKTYVNGILRTTVEGTFDPQSISSWYLGQSSPLRPLANRFFLGRIDELMLWNSQLADGDIQQIYEWRRNHNRSAALQLRMIGNPAAGSYTLEAILNPVPFDIRVEFFVDGRLYRTQTEGPYSLFDDDGLNLYTGKLGTGVHQIQVFLSKRDPGSGTFVVVAEGNTTVTE